MTYDKALRDLDSLLKGPRDWYRIARFRNDDGQFSFTVTVCNWEGANPVQVFTEGEDPMLTRAIWDVLNVASSRRAKSNIASTRTI